MSWRQRDFMSPGRSLAVGDCGMAATSHPAVTLAAIDILRSGGNAVDAAIAAIALQGVIDPHMTGIGGDCFAIYAPASGQPVAINGSGGAPAKAELGWFRQQGLVSIPDNSPHAVTVPGAVDAWCRFSADYGSKALDEILRTGDPCGRKRLRDPSPLRAGLGALCQPHRKTSGRCAGLSARWRGTTHGRQADPSGARRDAAPHRPRGTRRVLRRRRR